MKVGADNKFELYVAILLAVLALASVGYWVSSTAPTPAATPAPAAKVAANRALINPLDPTLRLDLLDSSQNVKYEGKGRDIFRPGAPIIEKVEHNPLDKGGPKHPQPPPQPQPQGPPPINIKFFGMASHAGEAPRVFLSEGDSVFIAREGDVVDSRYKVVKITPQSVEIEDLLNNNRQTISLSQG